MCPAESVELLSLSSVDLSRMAERIDASARFPLLIEALIYASSRTVSKLDFHASDDNLRPGWDGIVEQQDVHAWVPQGVSYWELSTQKATQKKAESDYLKRLKEPSSGLSRSTFVWVTLRPYSKARELEQKWRDRGDWKDVRVYDGKQLAQWLRETPVLFPMAAQLLRLAAPRSISTLDVFGQRWACRCSPPLTSALFLPQVERYREDFLYWLRNPKEDFTIYAESLTEGTAFLYALMEHEAFAPFRSRVLVFQQADEAQLFLARAPQTIAVAADDAVREACVSGEKPVPLINIVPLRAQLPQHMHFAYLGSMNYRAIEAFTRDLSPEDKQKVESIVARDGYSRSTLRRRLLSYTPDPAWASLFAESPALIALDLLGEWNPDDAESCGTFAILSGQSKDDSLLELSRLLERGETPVRYQHSSYMYGSWGKVWTLSSPRETREQVLKCLSAAQKQAFLRVAEQMLVSHTQRYSVSVLAALCGSLLLFLECIEESRPCCHTDMAEAIRSILKRRMQVVPYSQMMRQTYLLPYMAELLPEAWSQWVNRLIADGAAFLPALHRQSSLPWLIDALSRLAIPPRFFRSAVESMVRLYLSAPDEAAAKKVGEAIGKALHAWFPQTQAFMGDRRQMMRYVCEQIPALGWSLCMRNLVRRPGGMVLCVSTHRSGDEWVIPAGLPSEEVMTVRRESLEILLSWKTCTPAQLHELFSLVPFYASPWREQLWQKVWGRVATMDESDKTLFYEQALEMMGEQKRLGRAPQTVEWMRWELLSRLMPQSPVYRYRWCFSSLAVSLFRRRNFTLKQEAEIRGRLLRRFLRQYPGKFAELLASSRTNAEAMGEGVVLIFPLQEIVGEWKRLMLSSRELSAQENAYLRGMAGTVASALLYEPLCELLKRCSAEQAWKLLRPLGPSGLCLQLLPHAPAEVQEQYWRSLPVKRYHIGTDRPEYVAECLLSVRRPGAAWTVLEMAYQTYPQNLVARILRAMSLAQSRRISNYLAVTYDIPRQIESDPEADGEIFEVIEYLVQQGTVSALRAACMEFRFSDIAACRGIPLRHLSSLLAAHPRLAVRVLVHLEGESGYHHVVDDVSQARLRTLLNQSLMQINIPAHLPNTDAFCAWCRTASEELLRLKVTDICRYDFTKFLVGGGLHTLRTWLTDEMARATEPYLSISDSIRAYADKIVSMFRWESVCDSENEHRRKRLIVHSLNKRVGELKQLRCHRVAAALCDIVDTLTWEIEHNNPAE